MQVTQPCMMTKLPIIQYKTHTTLRLHGETIPTMILARSLQDLPSPKVRFTNVGLLNSSSMLVVLTW